MVPTIPPIPIPSQPKGLIDVHCHLDESLKTIPAIDTWEVTKQAALMGTQPTNWDHILALTEQYPTKLIGGVGTALPARFLLILFSWPDGIHSALLFFVSTFRLCASIIKGLDSMQIE
jgi:hypothetical protein